MELKRFGWGNSFSNVRIGIWRGGNRKEYHFGFKLLRQVYASWRACPEGANLRSDKLNSCVGATWRNANCLGIHRQPIIEALRKSN